MIFRLKYWILIISLSGSSQVPDKIIGGYTIGYLLFPLDVIIKDILVNNRYIVLWDIMSLSYIIKG